MAKTTAILTQEDIQLIAKTKSIVQYVLAGFALIVCLFVFFFFGGTASLVIIAIILLLFGVLFFVVNSNLKKDLTNATKNIYIGTITKKETVAGAVSSSSTSNDTTTYYITIDSDRIAIGFNLYDKCSEGKKIELHIAEKSGMVLKAIHL